MRIHPFASALLAACACAPVATTQGDTILRPASGEVTTAGIHERADALDLFAGRGSTDPAGRMTLRTAFAVVQGTEAVVRTETTWISEDLVQVDSFVMDRRTLAPLYYRSTSDEEVRALEFSPGQVRAVRQAGRGADTTVVDLPEPVFLSSAMDLILAALPLAEGYTARIAVYDADEGEQTAVVQVRGAEDVRLPRGRRVAAWRVRVAGSGSAGTYWMDRESHALVQYAAPGGEVRLVRAGDAPPGRRETR